MKNFSFLFAFFPLTLLAQITAPQVITDGYHNCGDITTYEFKQKDDAIINVNVSIISTTETLPAPPDTVASNPTSDDDNLVLVVPPNTTVNAYNSVYEDIELGQFSKIIFHQDTTWIEDLQMEPSSEVEFASDNCDIHLSCLGFAKINEDCSFNLAGKDVTVWTVKHIRFEEMSESYGTFVANTRIDINKNASKDPNLLTIVDGELWAGELINIDNEGTIGCFKGCLAQPVELIYARAIKTAQSVNILWETSWEESSDYYTLEHSRDGKNFTKISTILSKNSSNGSLYRYVHREPATMNYYRLSQTDFDGTVTHLQTMSLQFTPKTFEIYTSSQGLHVSTKEKFDLRLFSMNGKQIKYQINPGISLIPVDQISSQIGTGIIGYESNGSSGSLLLVKPK